MTRFLTACIGVCFLAVGSTAKAQVVISQFFGGGASGGATYTNDFVELCNRGSTTVDISGWTIQYAATTGTAWTSTSAIATGVTLLLPGQYYLVQAGSSGTSGALLLPTPDLTTTAISMAVGAGKVALVKNSTLITNGTSCPTGATIADFVGYGTGTNCFEGAGPTATLTATTSAFRLNNGCVDTDSNSADFATGTPRPRNSASPRNLCVSGLSESIADAGGTAGSANGTLGANEYGPSNNSYQFGGDGSGFAGMIGYFANSSTDNTRVLNPRIFFKSDDTGVNIGLRLGANFGGANDSAIILLDTVSGGVNGGTTISFNNGDATQRAIGRAIQSAPGTFGVDVAVGINSFGVFGFNVAAGGLTFQSGNTTAGTGLLASQFREIRIPYSNLSGFSPGGNINFVVSVNNGAASPSTFEGDESIPVSRAFCGAGNPGNSGGTLTNYNRFVTASCAAINIQPQSTIGFIGHSATFSVQATGFGTLTYQWRKDSVNIDGATGATYTITSVSAADAGSYEVVVTGSCGSATSSAATLSVECFSSSQVAQILASDGAISDNFGTSVSVSGDTAVVGAYLDDDAGASSGSAYVFVRSGGMWSQQAKLTASDAAAGDNFGFSVSVSGDTAVIGAYLDDTLAGADAGSAYVFVRSGSVWTQQAKLTASDGAAIDRFGFSVSVNGETAVVGAPMDDTPAGSDAGSAYVFLRSSGVWMQQAKLTASDGAASDRFGFSVSATGDTAVVGAYLDDTPAGADAGSAYVFARSGAAWAQQTKLTASDAAANDRFGYSVSASGETAVVGAYQDDTPAGSDAGSAYVFVRSGATWTQQAKLTASDAESSDLFGCSVGVSGDTAVIGAYLDDTVAGSDAGSVYVFVRSGAVWTEQTRLSASDAGPGDDFGFSVSLSADTVLVGAPADDTTAGFDAGSAYLYSLGVAPLSITTQPADQTICEGNSASFSVTATGASPISYQWRKGATNLSDGVNGFGTTIAGATLATLSLTNVHTGDADNNYHCVVTDACGSVTSSDATLAVQAQQTATVGGDQTICVNGTTGGLGGNTPTSGTGGWSVFSGGIGTFNPNDTTPNATFSQTGGAGPIVLRWTISYPPCTDSSADGTVTISQPPTTATVGGDQTICANGTTSGLGGNTPAVGSGLWSAISGGTGTFNPNDTTANATFTHTGGAGPIVLRWTISNAPCTDSSADVTVTIVGSCDDSDGCTTDTCVSGVCQHEAMDCGHGTCLGGSCLCDSGWVGVQCDTPTGSCCTDPGCQQTTEAQCNILSGTWTMLTPCADTDGDGVGDCDDLCPNTPNGESVNSNGCSCSQIDSCDDGDACTTDSCEAGACIHAPIICNDNDSCTIDSCVDGECVYTPMVCDDNNSCTVDTCDDGECVYTPINCNATLTLTPPPGCITGNQLIVSVDLSTAPRVVVGGQFFFAYDNSVLAFMSADPGDTPFLREIYEFVNPSAGEIDYAVGINDGDNGTAANTTMARLTFNFLQDVCSSPNLVSWRVSGPDGAQSELSDDNADPVVISAVNLSAIRIDSTPPSITCPADATFECDGSGNAGQIAEWLATAICADSCGGCVVTNDYAGLSDGCGASGSAVVTFTATDDCGHTATCTATVTVVDTTAPVLGPCPGDITVNADAGGCTAVVSFSLPSATDNCGGTPGVAASPPSGSSFASGATPVTVTATDACGNTSTCVFTVTVQPDNELVVNVELGGGVVATGPFTRAITFDLWNPTVSPTAPLYTTCETLTFTGGASGPVTLSVPCQATGYTCLTARDRLHTLRRTISPLPTSGVQYTANFTGTKALISGNLNDDKFVDILDFGIYLIQDLTGVPGGADTACGQVPPFRHDDVNGDWLVNSTDFSFIANNFLRVREVNCNGAALLADDDSPGGNYGPSPLTSITVAELRARGLGNLAAADLNHDRVLNQTDVALWLQGVRPSRPVSPVPVDVEP